MYSFVRRLAGVSLATASAALLVASAQAQNGPNENANARAKSVAAYWSKDKVAAATPRDLYLDAEGLAYTKNAAGGFVPYGHSKPYELTAEKLKAVPTPKAKPGSGDTTPPTISGMSPADGATFGTAQVFEANVTDASGVKSVTFNVTYTGGSQSFVGTLVSGSTYQVSLSGFPAGPGSWNVTATDNVKGQGNTTTSPTLTFTAGSGGGGGGGGGGGTGDDVANERYADGGDIQTAAGRIYFEMPQDRRFRRWAGYICSGTVVTDSTTGRSVIQTAAHCVYDDVYKAFARNVLFIPNQDQTTGTGTDLNCSNDPIGCWAPSFGVVDVDWTTRSFPDNIPWDWGYYVVSDTGAHSGSAASSDALDQAVPPMTVNFGNVAADDGADGAGTPDFTHAMGYSGSDDPFFMYCAEDMTDYDSANWLQAQCDLSGGSSGGPWIQPLTNGAGPLMSVNSWGYTGSPGMYGPKLNNGEAQCTFDEARFTNFTAISTADGEEGFVASGC